MNEHAISQLVYFAVIAVIAISRAVAKSRKKSDDQPPSRPLTRIERPSADTELERQRRFREALGLPPDTTVPPPIRPRPVQQQQQGPLPTIPVSQGPAAFGIPRRIYTGVPHKTGTPAPAPTPAPAYAPAPAAVAAPTPPPPITMPVPAAPLDLQTPLIPILQASLATELPSPPRPAAAPAPTRRASTAEILRRLRDPVSIRQAIILREVLGPPKALQPALASAGSQWPAH